MRVFRVDPGDKERARLGAFAADMRYCLPEGCEYFAAVDDREALSGFAAVLPGEDVSDILFIYVMESKRRMRAGSLLLRGLEGAVREAGGEAVRCVMPARDDLMGLFAGEGYEFFPGEREYAVSFGTLYYSSLYRKHVFGKPPKRAKSPDEFTPAEKKALAALLTTEGVTLGSEKLNTHLSSAVLDGSGIYAALLCEVLEKGILVDYIYVHPDHMELFTDCLRLLDSRLPSVYGERVPEMKLSFSTGNDKEEALLKYISGNIAPLELFTREYAAVKPLTAPETPPLLPLS